MKKQIPNLLTIFRILLVPVFVYCIFFLQQYTWATIVFILASITDFFDGHLARRMNVISNFGKIMDPLADKILVAAALIALCFSPMQYTQWFVVCIILFREVAVTLLRNYYVKKNIFIPANWWGKIKTTLQMIGIIAALVFHSSLSYFSFSGVEISNVKKIFHLFFWIVAVVTVLSGMNYFKGVFTKKER